MPRWHCIASLGPCRTLAILWPQCPATRATKLPRVGNPYSLIFWNDLGDKFVEFSLIFNRIISTAWLSGKIPIVKSSGLDRVKYIKSTLDGNNKHERCERDWYILPYMKEYRLTNKVTYNTWFLIYYNHSLDILQMNNIFSWLSPWCDIRICYVTVLRRHQRRLLWQHSYIPFILSLFMWSFI